MAVFSFLDEENLRTIAYIDGFNLYYGCLKSTQYKWVDLFKLCQRIATEHNPSAELVQVKFFTADIKARLSRHGDTALHSQQSYHRALQALYQPPQLEIIKGYYTIQQATQPPYKKPIRMDEKIAVWRIEEKQTDVNIALNMYRDAVQDDTDAMLVLSNDSDIAPAIEAVKELNSSIDIGVIIPRREDAEARLPNRSLSALADWTRGHIKALELYDSQMPDLVPTHKKPAIKPDYW